MTIGAVNNAGNMPGVDGVQQNLRDSTASLKRSCRRSLLGFCQPRQNAWISNYYPTIMSLTKPRCLSRSTTSCSSRSSLSVVRVSSLSSTSVAGLEDGMELVLTGDIGGTNSRLKMFGITKGEPCTGSLFFIYRRVPCLLEL